jgi:hypothetical protein
MTAGWLEGMLPTAIRLNLVLLLALLDKQGAPWEGEKAKCSR